MRQLTSCILQLPTPNICSTHTANGYADQYNPFFLPSFLPMFIQHALYKYCPSIHLIFLIFFSIYKIYIKNYCTCMKLYQKRKQSLLLSNCSRSSQIFEKRDNKILIPLGWPWSKDVFEGEAFFFETHKWPLRKGCSRIRDGTDQGGTGRLERQRSKGWIEV